LPLLKFQPSYISYILFPYDNFYKTLYLDVMFFAYINQKLVWWYLKNFTLMAWLVRLHFHIWMLSCSNPALLKTDAGILKHMLWWRYYVFCGFRVVWLCRVAHFPFIQKAVPSWFYYSNCWMSLVTWSTCYFLCDFADIHNSFYFTFVMIFSTTVHFSLTVM